MADNLNILDHNGAVYHSSIGAVTAAADTAENALYTLTVPGGAIGPNGSLHVSFFMIAPGITGTHTMRVRLGGISGTVIYGQAKSANTTWMQKIVVKNLNSASSQAGYMDFQFYDVGADGNAKTAAIDTSADMDLVISGQKTVGGDTLTLQFAEVVINYAA